MTLKLRNVRGSCNGCPMDRPSFRCSECGFDLWTPLIRLSVSTIGFYNDSRFPGRCIVALDDHHERFELLPDHLVAAFTFDGLVAARAIANVTGAVRINYAILGNTVPHVHTHLIPRTLEGDPQTHRTPWESDRPKTKLPKQEIATLCTAIIIEVRKQVRNEICPPSSRLRLPRISEIDTPHSKDKAPEETP